MDIYRLSDNNKCAVAAAAAIDKFQMKCQYLYHNFLCAVRLLSSYPIFLDETQWMKVVFFVHCDRDTKVFKGQ